MSVAIPPAELTQLESALDLTTPQLAKLLGVSVRTLYRGLEREGAPATLVRALQKFSTDPRSALIVRALVLASAQQDGSTQGLPFLLDRLFDTFVMATRLQLR